MEMLVKRFLNKKNYNPVIPVIKKRDDFKVNVTGFSYNYLRNTYKLTLYSDLLYSDNYSISIIDNRLVVIISEIKEYIKPSYVHNVNWNYSDTRLYERIRSIDVLMPGNDFYLIRHYVIPNKSLLHVILSTNSR